MPSCNAAPSQDIPVILNEQPDELRMVRWGLVPSWARDEKMGNRLINARAETAAHKPAFKRLIRSRRCLIVADSFFEWQRLGSRKVPFRVLMTDGGIFAFAGLWDLWAGGKGPLTTCAILTTEPNTLVRPIHHRMPVILAKGSEKTWLSDIPLERALSLLKPYPAKEMKAYPVSPRVNSPGNNSPDVLAPES